MASLYRLDDKMQYHIFTLGRNVKNKVDAISTNDAIEFFDILLRNNYDIDCFSFYEGKGYWNGTPENTLRFEVFGLPDGSARQLAATLASEFNQEAVMLLSVNSRPKFITGKVA